MDPWCLISNKGPLASIWLAAHLQKRLSKQQVLDCDLDTCVKQIASPGVAWRLQTAAHLLLGAAQMYNKKAMYFLEDANDALRNPETVSERRGIDFPGVGEARSEAITIQEISEFEEPLPEISETELTRQQSFQQSSKSEITMQENVGNLSTFEGTFFSIDFGASGTEKLRDDSAMDYFIDKNAAIVALESQKTLPMECEDEDGGIFGGLYEDDEGVIPDDPAAASESEGTMVDLPQPVGAIPAADSLVPDEPEAAAAAAAATKRKARGKAKETEGAEMLPAPSSYSGPRSCEPKKKVRKLNHQMPDEEEPSCSYQEARSEYTGLGASDAPSSSAQCDLEQAAKEAELKAFLPSLQKTPEPQLLGEYEESGHQDEEEPEWNKNPQQMLRDLQKAVATTGNESISFFEMTRNAGRKEVAGKFYCLLELANLRAIDLKQEESFGDITIIPASRFYDL